MSVRDHRTGALRHHLQKPRKGKSYTGSAVRRARQGLRLRAPHRTLGSCSRTRGTAGSLLQPATQPALAQRPSASVVDMEVESLVSEQGVRVIKLEQVDALPGVVMAASLHISVAVPPVHRHDLPVAAP